MTIEETRTGNGMSDTVLVPTAQRTVLLVEGEEVTAVRVGPDIVVPVTPRVTKVRHGGRAVGQGHNGARPLG